MSGPFDIDSLVEHHSVVLQGIQDQISSSPNGDFYNLQDAPDVIHPLTGQTYGGFVAEREDSKLYKIAEFIGEDVNKPHVQKFHEIIPASDNPYSSYNKKRYREPYGDTIKNQLNNTTSCFNNVGFNPRPLVLQKKKLVLMPEKDMTIYWVQLMTQISQKKVYTAATS